MKYPPTPLGAVALRCASAKASEGYPPVAKSAGASILRHMNDSVEAYAFIHGQSPWSSALADKDRRTFDKELLRQRLTDVYITFAGPPVPEGYAVIF